MILIPWMCFSKVCNYVTFVLYDSTDIVRYYFHGIAEINLFNRDNNIFN